MIIKFDFGTQKDVSGEVIAYVIDDIIRRHSDLHAGKCSVYLNFYDDDGADYAIVDENKNAEINYLVRLKKYTRKPKNKECISTLIDRNTEEPIAYVYEVYDEIKD